MFQGSYAALVTPFRNGVIDEGALENLIHWQIEQGTHGLVVVGTTGESPTLSQGERFLVMELAAKAVSGRCPLIAGAGSNDPQKALTDTRHAQQLGIDATLHVAGYYNRPHQDGLYAHFKHIHDDSSIPMMIYNIPPRAVVDIQPETMARLSRLPRVIGVKDATGDVTRVWHERRQIDRDFCWFSGEDATAVFYNMAGGQGCISVTANVAPKQVAQMQQCCLDKDWEQARVLQEKLMPLHEALFLEPSPSGVKYALSLLGHCTEACRLPLTPLSRTTKETIQTAMTHLGLLS